MLDIKQKLSPYNHYVGGNDIKYIVVHDTGNSTDTADANANYFYGGDRGASAHYFVDDNNICQVVKDSDGAWHCGDGNGAYGVTNKNSIGIEMCRVNNNVTDKTESNTIELVKSLMQKYNVPVDRVVRHYDASRKNCPSSFSPNGWARWAQFKNKLTVAPQPAAPASPPAPVVPDINFNILMFGHIQDIGNVDTSGVNTCMIGTTGKSKRLEAFSLDITPDVELSYLVHQQSTGDITGARGQLLGSKGQGKRLEGIQIFVTNIPDGYELQYRAHVEGIGWTNWTCNEYCGTRGKFLRLEAVEVRTVKKN